MNLYVVYVEKERIKKNLKSAPNQLYMSPDYEDYTNMANVYSEAGGFIQPAKRASIWTAGVDQSWLWKGYQMFLASKNPHMG